MQRAESGIWQFPIFDMLPDAPFAIVAQTLFETTAITNTREHVSAEFVEISRPGEHRSAG